MGGKHRWPGALLLGLTLATAPATTRADEVDCLIEPWRSITLSAAIEGVVEEVMVDRGDLVEQDQVLARLESSVERASVELARIRAAAKGRLRSAEARLQFAERSLDRQKTLEEKDIVSESDMDEALSAQRVAEAELLASREAQQEAKLDLRRNQAVLDRRTIRSPVTGVVVERILSPGEYADPPQILRLAQIDPLRVEVFAPLSLFGRVSEGMQAQVLPEAPVGGSLAATVTMVDRVVDAASATFAVHLELPNPDLAVPAGLNCRVVFPEPEGVAGVDEPEADGAPPSPSPQISRPFQTPERKRPSSAAANAIR